MSKGMNKEAVLVDLKDNWDSLNPKQRKDLVYSLLGHRLSLKSIAEQISRTLEEVKAAYRGDILIVSAQAPVVPECGILEDCGSDTYQGIKAPTCAGGVGCKKCWAVYHVVHNLDGNSVSPKVAEAAPLKAMYALSFDEILEKYREWIGMTAKSAATPAEPLAGDGYLKGIIVSDLHAPFHDEPRFAKMIEDTKGKVDVCILAGDGADFHNYSKYLKYGQHFSMKEEHKAYVLVLRTLSEAYPEVIVMPGNHDERTRKKYATLLPADLYQSLLDFHGPNAFDFAELMTQQFENIVVPTMPSNGFAEYRFVYQINDIVIGHPELYSKIPNKSVGGFIDWVMKKAVPMGLVHNPISAAVMGHTHMAGKTFNDYAIIGIENGCVCMTPDYDAQPKLNGAARPLTRGYTLFKTNKKTGLTKSNDINFIELY
jgi:predicted phosphodiesterase